MTPRQLVLSRLREIDGEISETGLNREEEEVMNSLAKAWGDFCKLPRQHPDELKDFTDSIHRCQDLLALRVCRRFFPKGWTNTEGGLNGRRKKNDSAR